MRLLVTGGAGFIGSHTCERLLRAGHEVCAADDLSTGKVANLAACHESPNFRFTEVDVVDESFGRLVEEWRPDTVLHLAAQMDVRRSVADPLADARVNVLGTVRTLDAVSRAGSARVVFASSGGTVYGEPEHVKVPEHAPLRPLSPYGAAKVAGETYVAAFAGLYGFAYCSLALGNVYGPRQDPHGEAGVVSIFARAMLEGDPTRIYGDGTAIRDYVHVDDVCAALQLAAEGRGDGRRLNIASGRGVSVRELHTSLAAITGAEDSPVFMPARTGELQRIVLDVGAAEQSLGWSPEIGLDDGLQDTVEWVRKSASSMTSGPST
jgi:UDP-glucose 4-epimerase